MKIELYYVNPETPDGKAIFTAPIVPMLARRKFIELEAAKEAKGDMKTEGYTPDEFDEMCTILTDIVFRNQFTLEQLIGGASEKYINDKLLEAVWGIKPSDELGNSEGNKTGK